MRLLVLGGTLEARQLVESIAGHKDIEVVLSLAGHTSDPVDVPVPVRRGGFGGIEGLVAYLRSEGVNAIVDATHPFAPAMPHHAVAAAAATGVPLLRLVRPPWVSEVGDGWISADDLSHAARLVHAHGADRVLLTIGRLELARFADLDDVHFVVRSIEAPDPMPLAQTTIVRGRGPFSVDAETTLLREHGIELIVTKNSGGDNAKLVAARRLDLEVVMVCRPPLSRGHVTSPDDAVAWIEALPNRASTRG